VLRYRDSFTFTFKKDKICLARQTRCLLKAFLTSGVRTACKRVNCPSSHSHRKLYELYVQEWLCFTHLYCFHGNYITAKWLAQLLHIYSAANVLKTNGKEVKYEWKFYFRLCCREKSLPPLLSHIFSLMLAVIFQLNCCQNSRDWMTCTQNGVLTCRRKLFTVGEEQHCVSTLIVQFIAKPSWNPTWVQPGNSACPGNSGTSLLENGNAMFWPLQ
jgi:hypothetical protein